MDLGSIEAWLRPDESLDLNNCDREPIHIPGSVQPVGALVAVDDDGALRLASESFYSLVEPDEIAALLESLAPLCEKARTARSVTSVDIRGRTFAAIAHTVDGLTVIELEPAPDGQPLDPGALADIFAEIESGERLADLLATVTRSVRELIGFDRVMGYVFDDEGHGSVIAEARSSPEVDSFLGLRFPDTDIPQQARRLYAIEWVRQIVDVDAPTSALVPEENPVSGRPLNMAFCQLRSVSPIHLDYLRNMGVAASFSISVVVEGELVALIACHHNSPKHIPYSTRRACELIGRHASQRLEHLSADNQRLERAKRLSTQVELLSRLAGESGLSANNEAWSSIAEFVEADAFLVCIGEERTSFSGLSLHEEFWSLGARFAREASDRCRSEVQLGRLDQEAPDGGMLLVPISGFGWVAWFRRAIDRIVVWAGAPSDQAQKTLTPRSSFEAYKQIVRGQCSAWTENEQDIAEVLRRGLNARFVEVESGDSFEQVLRQTREYVEMLEETNQQLTASNEDLRQFAYAASHDFKAPLRTIRSFLPMIENELGDISDRTRSWFNFVNRAADNLQRLQDGLWAFTRVNKDTAFEEVDLNHVVERVLAGIAADFENAVVTVRRLPMAYGIPQQIETVFRNLLENASKYRSPDRQLRVIIEAAHHDAKGVTISVSDNGIGFPPHSEERIFELFSRVHVEHKDGDGLGLAMCRRILHHHGGWIRARGEPGSGATFEMLLRRPEEAPT